jgi:hypothetical protein
MTRMNEQDRQDWMNGKRNAYDIASDVTGGEAYQCDECDSPARAITHKGSGSRPVVQCAEHFKAMLARDRADRPSRAELVARVSA